MSRIVTILIGIILLGLLYQYGARQKAPEIQADIQARTSAAIADEGFANARVATDGRDVTLDGTVDRESDIDRAGTVARGVRGVRVVDNRLSVALPYTVSLCKEATGVALEGAVPSPAARTQLSARAAELFHHLAIDNSLSIRADAPEGLTPFLSGLLQELAQLDRGCAEVEDQNASLSGSVRSQAAAERIREEIGRLGDSGFVVALDLDVPTLSEEAALCQDEYNRRLAPGERVLFDFDSAELHDEGRRLLDEIIAIGENCPDVGVLVTGHTDSVGGHDYNIELSQRRADAVVDYLVSRGVDSSRLTAIGFGMSQPVADNATDEGRARNRRIEFRVRED